jgi:hypothetical protein
MKIEQKRRDHRERTGGLKAAAIAGLLAIVIALATSATTKAAQEAARRAGETREEILADIMRQRREIERLIAENEAKLRKLRSEESMSLRKADFYAKPVYPSTQVFFTYEMERGGAMKNRTEKEFREDIATIAKAYPHVVAFDADVSAQLYNAAIKALVEGNGTVTDDLRFSETIDVGANVVPATPAIPAVNKSVAVAVTAPDVTLGDLPDPKVTPIPVPIVTPPEGISSIDAPVAPQVSVLAPNAPAEVRVQVETPEAPVAPEVAGKTVTIPETPEIEEPKISTISPTTVFFKNGGYQGEYYWHGDSEKPSIKLSRGTATNHKTIANVPDGSPATSNSYIGFWGICESVTIDVNITVAIDESRAILIDEATHGNNYTSQGEIKLKNTKNIGIDLQGTHFGLTGNTSGWDWVNINDVTVTNEGTIIGVAGEGVTKQMGMGFNNYDHSSNNTMTRLVNTGEITMNNPQSLGIQLKPEIRNSDGVDSQNTPASKDKYGGSVMMTAVNQGTITMNNANSYALSSVPFFRETNTQTHEGVNEGRFSAHNSNAFASGLYNQGAIYIAGDESIGIGLFWPIQAVKNEANGLINVIAGNKAVGVYSEAATMYIPYLEKDVYGTVVTDPKGAGTATVEVEGQVNVTENATQSAGVRTGLADGKITVKDGGVITVDAAGNYGAVQASSSGSIVLESGSEFNISGSNSVGYVLMDGSGKNSGTVTATGAIGFYGVKGTFVNNADGVITASGAASNALVLKEEGGTLKFTNDGKITIGVDGSTAVFLDGGEYIQNMSGEISAADETVGLYNFSGKAAVKGKITVGDAGNSAAIGVLSTSQGAVTFSGNAELDIWANSIGLYTLDQATNNFTIDALSVKLGQDAVLAYYDQAAAPILDLSNVTIATVGAKSALVYADGKAKVTVTGDKSISNLDSDNEDFIAYIAKGDGKITLDADLTTNGKVGMAGIGGGDIALKAKKTLKMTGLKDRPNDVGIYSDGGAVTNEGNIVLSPVNQGMIGILGEKNKAATPGSISNSGTITLEAGESQNIGIFAQDGTSVSNSGVIHIESDNAVGIYLENSDLVLNLDTGSNLNFNSSIESVGIYLDGKKTVTIDAPVNFTSPNAQKDILIYVTGGGKVANNNAITVDGTADDHNDEEKTVGIYLEGGADANEYAGGTLDVSNEAVGIYSNNYNVLTLGTLTAQNVNTVGVYLAGAAKISGTVRASDQAVGVYGKGGKVVVDNAGLTLELDTEGVGMYLKDGAYAAGATIVAENADTKNTNVALYYDPASDDIAHKTDLVLEGDNKLMGIYLADGAKLSDAKDIRINAAASVGAMAGKGSTFTAKGDINLNAGGDVGLYTEKGTVVNEGTVAIATGLDKKPTGMAGITRASDDSAAVVNIGKIEANDATGMYLGGPGVTAGENRGIIETTTGTAVYVKGVTSKFTNTGTLKTADEHGIALYLDGSGVDAVDTIAGKLEIGKEAIAVYADNGAVVDFDVAPEGEKLIGLVAANGAEILSNVCVGDGSVGIYVADNRVKIADTVSVETGYVGNGSPVGIFLATGMGAYTLEGTNIDAKNGIGIYLEDYDEDDDPAAVGLTLKGAAIQTEGGVAVFAGEGTTLDTDGIEITLKDGQGIYVAKGATANIGQGSDLDIIRFETVGGIGMFNDEGTIYIGQNLELVGNGTIAATRNGELINKNIVALEGVTAYLGIYNVGTIEQFMENTEEGDITVTAGGTAMAAIRESNDKPAAAVRLINRGQITVSGASEDGTQPSVGLYTDVADVLNEGKITVGDDAFGIYLAGGGSLSNKEIHITGANAVGVYISGKVGTITASDIHNGPGGNTGIVFKNITEGGNTGIGTVSLGDNSVGVLAADSTGKITLTGGDITLGDGSDAKRSVGAVSTGGSDLVFRSDLRVTIGEKGIGVYADSGAKISFDAGSLTLGAGSFIAYAKDGHIVLTGGDIAVDGEIGMVFEGGNFTNAGGGKLFVSGGGTGVYVKTTDVTGIPDGFIEISGGSSSAAPYTTGVYYDAIAGTAQIPQITLAGGYKAVGAVLSNTAGQAAKIVVVGASAADSVGVAALTGSSVSLSGGVSVSGDKNTGLYAEGGAVSVRGPIIASTTTVADDLSTASIGVYQKGSNYRGDGTITANDGSIGVYGAGLEGTSTQSGDISVGAGAVGLYMSGKTGGAGAALELDTRNNSLRAGDGGLGLYTKDMDLRYTGDMDLADRGAIGIVSEGKGDVNYSGSVRTGSGGSLAIYKKISGNERVKVSVADGDNPWTIGDGGYGLYALEESGTGMITLTNSADISLGKSALGIYAKGKVNVENTGDITVGATDFGDDMTTGHTETKKHLNSVAIYAAEGAQVVNKGLLTADKDHSLAVYAEGEGTVVTNEGTIEINNGGIGMLVREGAEGINAAGGIINLGANQPAGVYNVGMAAYKNGKITNYGTINVNEGVGMLVGAGGILDNKSVIRIVNGYGIQGSGTVLNEGQIYVSGGGAAVVLDNSGYADVGAVRITADGAIRINGNYVSVGGTLYTDGKLILDGAYADITSGAPVFAAGDIEGNVRILPDFALTGNGKTYEVVNFVSAALSSIEGSKVTPVIGPLFVGKISDAGTLVIAKRPYPDITVGNRFDTIYGQWDDLLDRYPDSPDARALKEMNYYLAGLYDPAVYNSESARLLSETRGDIYATIQSRMDHMQRGFDRSFEELLESRNLTRETDKYSVIHRRGQYRDPTMAIDDYDYETTGLYYMKEYDGKKFGDKYGWSLGFAVGSFTFDDTPLWRSPSKERVYSARTGLHYVKNLGRGDSLRWISRLELGYNRHEAKRKLEMEKLRTNKAGYDSWIVSLDNTLAKTFYHSLRTRLEGYVAVNLEYGAVEGFGERYGTAGGMLVEVKGADYFSAAPEIGISAERKCYIGAKTSVKLRGRLGWLYEFGENYPANKTRSRTTGGDWMRLAAPEPKKKSVVGAAALTLEKADHFGVSLEVEARKQDNRDKTDITWGLRLHYKFMK